MVYLIYFVSLLHSRNSLGEGSFSIPWFSTWEQLMSNLNSNWWIIRLCFDIQLLIERKVEILRVKYFSLERMTLFYVRSFSTSLISLGLLKVNLGYRGTMCLYIYLELKILFDFFLIKHWWWCITSIHKSNEILMMLC